MNRTNIINGRHEEGKQLRALQMRREMTPSERLLWQHLRGSRLAGLHFRRQQVIDGFIADFYCHGAGLVVEVDGSVHDDRAGYDAERDQIIAARGLRVLRFPNRRVERETKAVCAEIQQAARQQQETLRPFNESLEAESP